MNTMVTLLFFFLGNFFFRKAGLRRIREEILREFSLLFIIAIVMMMIYIAVFFGYVVVLCVNIHFLFFHRFVEIN